MGRTPAWFSKIGKLTKEYSNLPDSYIKRATEQVHWKTPRAPQYLPRTIERNAFRFTTNRPWTTGFRDQNLPGTGPRPVLIEPILNWSFFRGDRVEVLVGRDKGKQGIVSQVIQERNWVIVRGLNTHLRVIGKSNDFPGVHIQSEAPLLVTTGVALVDPSDLQGCSIEWRYTEDGKPIRISTRTGREIPIPVTNEETKDYKLPKLYKAGPKDTGDKQVTKVTFKPELKTFEMDIMEKMGIKEDREVKKYFWY